MNRKREKTLGGEAQKPIVANITCSTCGQKGNYSTECTHLENKDSAKSFICNKSGHKKRDCLEVKFARVHALE